MRFQAINLLPYAVAVLVIAAGFIIWRAVKFRKIAFSNVKSVEKSGKNISFYLVFLPDLLKIIGIILLMIALLRPQAMRKEEKEKVKGIDIMLALDVSGSMQAEDLQPNRLEAAKLVCRNFVSGLTSDRVGLVVFAGKSFTQCPLTVDYEIIRNFIGLVDLKTVRIDGTAIGEAILNAVNRLEASQGSRVIILATDGQSNRGPSPVDASKVAAVKNIKIYTIGIGKKGGAPMTMFDQYGVKRQYVDRRTGQMMKWEEPDEATLSLVAQNTGGKYFRATDEQALAEIYSTIAKLEKQEREVKVYNRYIERFEGFLLAGALLLFLAFLLEAVKFMRVLA